ncbi:iron uptake porin [Leptolyngbya sp. AN03gr2]|uniref:iron uptake porin n=1 Tax=unclassified Leptolyngbya TaxID=2650499 RepID=UPI003D30F9CF
MSKQIWRTIALSLTAVLVTLFLLIGQLLIGGAEAATPPALIAQVTSIDKVTDVDSNDPYFQALKSMMERYGCIAAFTDGTFRGYRPLTRIELAGTLNACLDRANELIAVSTADLAKSDDLKISRRLLDQIRTTVTSLRK